MLSWQLYPILFQAISTPLLIYYHVTLHYSILFTSLVFAVVSLQSLNAGSKFLHMISRQKKYLAGSVINFSTQHVSKYLVFNTSILN